jgi:putative tricarboxylic transport membrane protein
LTLGIPANVVMALMLGAFMIHGVTPGPFILKNHPDVFWGVITSMYIGNVLLLFLNVPLIKIFVKIIEIPYVILSPIIVFICLTGAYTINNNSLDVLLVIIFGCVGYLMRKYDFEGAPLILAFVLGPLLEISVRQSLIMSKGSPMIFFNRPISLVLMVIVFFAIFSPILIFGLKRSGLISSLRE